LLEGVESGGLLGSLIGLVGEELSLGCGLGDLGFLFSSGFSWLSGSSLTSST
jgi:hypothetical protein